jgi:hypothetical protein
LDKSSYQLKDKTFSSNSSMKKEQQKQLLNVSFNTLNHVGKAKNKFINQDQILYKAFSPKLIQINCKNERKQIRY